MSNKAAWCMSQGGKHEVKEAPMPIPEAGEVIIKNVAIAVNPIDWKMRDRNMFTKEFPTILGIEVAGEVVEIGENVTEIQVGQRVAAMTSRGVKQTAISGGYQLFSAARAIDLIPIPDNISFEEAAVLPVSTFTAAGGLFLNDKLAIELPYASGSKTNAGTILVWGGSSSVGCSVIQLAKASGLNVVTTASKHNFDLCKSLGADTVLDYKSPSIVDDLVREMKPKKFVGCFDCITIAESTVKMCTEIVSQIGGGTIVVTQPPPQITLPANVKLTMVFGGQTPAAPFGPDLISKYLPEVLKDRSFTPSPKPDVRAAGLDAIEEALEESKSGLSAKKLVIKV